MKWQNRTTATTFSACIDDEGNWFDSAESYELAKHWCLCAYGEGQENLTRVQGITAELPKGMSIVTSVTLRKMMESGLIKLNDTEKQYWAKERAKAVDIGLCDRHYFKFRESSKYIDTDDRSYWFQLGWTAREVNR